MFNLVPRFRTIAASAAIATGAILFAVSPISGQPTESATASSSLPTLAPMLEHVTPAVVNIAVVSRSPAENNPLYSATPVSAASSICRSSNPKPE